MDPVDFGPLGAYTDNEGENKMAWQVVLTRAYQGDLHKPGYFPRNFHYKKYALALAKEIEKRGGQAIVRKIK